jgi:hypothetical protein
MNFLTVVMSGNHGCEQTKFCSGNCLGVGNPRVWRTSFLNGYFSERLVTPSSQEHYRGPAALWCCDFRDLRDGRSLSDLGNTEVEEIGLSRTHETMPLLSCMTLTGI